MGDVLKLVKEKRHRSSSSLAGAVIEGTRSERKLELNASIPEGDDQFAVAESRCDDLQEKIDLIKILKRKRKLKKRSMTKMVDQLPPPENVPFITVRTQPKKKVSQQAARLRRLEVPQNPTRGYLDPAMVEQHRMIGQVRGYQLQQPEKYANRPSSQDHKPYSRARTRRSQAEGDNMASQGVQLASEAPRQTGSGRTDVFTDSSDRPVYMYPGESSALPSKKQTDIHNQTRLSPMRRKHVPKNIPTRTVPNWGDDNVEETSEGWPAEDRAHSPVARHRLPYTRKYQNAVAPLPNPAEKRPVVELFNKNRAGQSPDNRRQVPLPASASVEKKNKKVREPQRYEDQDTGPSEDVVAEPSRKEATRHPRRIRYRSHRYELPTVASQMKQAGMRYYYSNGNHTNIPFVVSKSTAPSHNIGVNIQQVLNGVKTQQPLSGIPLTIAYHMGLGHVPTYGTKSATMQPSLDTQEINVIKLGHKLLRLPSYKYMSYNRLLNLYREGDGMVPKFLRAISRPHYFYTSMYNSLATNRDDFDGATSKGRGGNQETKQSLAEYASLYREYQHIEKCIREGNYEPDLERRKESLARELAAREEHIRRVVQDYRASGEAEQPVLRASASTADNGYRHSTFKLNVAEPHQQ